MCMTYSCHLGNNVATFKEYFSGAENDISIEEFDEHIMRRQRSKLSTATKIAGVLHEKYDISKTIKTLGGDPHNTPIVIGNRFANWDYVSDDISTDISTTIKTTNNYVATAWFPATIQGYLTITYGNKGQAITLATKDNEMLAASIASMFDKDNYGANSGALIYGTFESIPSAVAGISIQDITPGSFGVISVFSKDDDAKTIYDTVLEHGEMYKNVGIYTN